MNYIPNTDADRAEMLKVVGAGSVAELFGDVPEGYRFPMLALPPALSEMEVIEELNALANENDDLHHLACFLGAGAYNHFVPSVVDFLLHRSEIFTAYTPYQPEISQGTLQAHYEYQSMICALTGMEVSNVSHYDGATAVAEAVIMALQMGRGKRNKVILSPTLNPQYRAVVRTYTQGMALEIVGEDAGPSIRPVGQSGDVLDALAVLLDKQTACVVVQNPDFLGRLYTPAEMQALADQVHAAGAQFVVSADPISLGVFVPPGQYGADVVTGEGQPMGNAISFGGPYLGFFAMKKDDVRRSAGRIVGQTVDTDGKRGFVLTLSTREQHIRREKASSNICSNQALNALAAAIYMAAMGKYGLRTVAELSYHKAHYAAGLIGQLPGYEVISRGPFFKEFVVRCPRPVAMINDILLERYGMVGGYDLGGDYPDLADHMLLCVTEMNSRAQIDLLVEALQEVTTMNPD
ncbi:MAG: glycine dehydrogenase subunit 1, partial [Chloroflexota bacterium]|nr:glycine dehydrogenase subunit 1 [Chloroflexota bacterium]